MSLAVEEKHAVERQLRPVTWPGLVVGCTINIDKLKIDTVFVSIGLARVYNLALQECSTK